MYNTSLFIYVNLFSPATFILPYDLMDTTVKWRKCSLFYIKFRPEVGHLRQNVELEKGQRGTTRMMKGVEQLQYQDLLS